MTITVETAAIMDHDGTVYSVPRPGRHHDVIRIMVQEHARPIPISGEQGFVLSDGSFCRRARARMIAEKAGQLKPNALNHRLLFSEDVW